MEDKLHNLWGKYKEIAKKVSMLSSMDQLLACTCLAYTEEVMVVPLSLKFKIPTMELYDGGRDPLKHLDTFKTHMTLHGYPGEVACRAFPWTLKRLAQVWFGSLAPGSINSFNELAQIFLTQFMSSQRR